MPDGVEIKNTETRKRETMTEIWYEIEYSVKGAGDWFSANASADTIEKIRQKLAEMAAHECLEFRAVKKTLTTEVVS